MIMVGYFVNCKEFSLVDRSGQVEAAVAQRSESVLYSRINSCSKRQQWWLHEGTKMANEPGLMTKTKVNLGSYQVSPPPPCHRRHQTRLSGGCPAAAGLMATWRQGRPSPAKDGNKVTLHLHHLSLRWLATFMSRYSLLFSKLSALWSCVTWTEWLQLYIMCLNGHQNGVLLVLTGGGTAGYYWRELPQVSFLLRQTCVCHDRTIFCCDKSMLAATKLLTKLCLSCQKFCSDKNMFVVSKVLSQQAYFCHNKRCVLLRQKRCIVATKLSLSRQNFCHDKIIFAVTNICPDKHTFVMANDVFCHNKHMFVVAKLFSRQKWYLWQLPPMIAGAMWQSCHFREGYWSMCVKLN